MNAINERVIGFAPYVLLLTFPLSAQPLDGCTEKVSAQIRLDAGHPWKPPFGTDRVGALPVAHVELVTRQATTREYSLMAYRGKREVERHKLAFSRWPPPYAESGVASTTEAAVPVFANVRLAAIPSDVVLRSRCEGRDEDLARLTVNWPHVEADATARPNSPINPVDLGVILPPHDWLLLTGEQTVVIEAAALSHRRDLPQAKLRAWFDGGKAMEVALPLMRNQRAVKGASIPVPNTGERANLHLALSDGREEVWRKEIHTMIVRKAPTWPAFGAVETKLRYDAPISVNDPKTSAPLPSIDYKTAWNSKLNDVVVFLPNGSRFVFWRGSSYAPFWAGPYNTGFSYQWAETIPPPGFMDAVEPLQDKELHYGRVRIVESTPSRVHVRWTYQSVDFQYRSVGDEATEDFYFYPDGFGTRVVTLASTRGDDYAFSEFIILLPQKAFPLEVLPTPKVDMLFLDGEKKRFTFPLDPAMYGPLTINVPTGKEAAAGQHSVERLLSKVLEYQGKEVAPFVVDLINQGLGKINHPRNTSIMYRIFNHHKDPEPTIYFSPSESNSTIAFLPFFDRGELVTPGYWGNHWPLGRGALTGGAIDDRIYSSPSHFSLMDLSEPKPLSRGQVQMLDTLGQSGSMSLQRWAWLIAKTNAPDGVLLDWAQSYSNPPSLELTGARIDFPSYSPERRAIRLIAESPSIDIKLEPVAHTVNPVFELNDAPKNLAGVTLDGKALTADAYAWDGATLWVKASIGASGAKIGVRFR